MALLFAKQEQILQPLGHAIQAWLKMSYAPNKEKNMHIKHVHYSSNYWFKSFTSLTGTG